MSIQPGAIPAANNVFGSLCDRLPRKDNLVLQLECLHVCIILEWFFHLIVILPFLSFITSIRPVFVANAFYVLT